MAIHPSEKIIININQIKNPSGETDADMHHISRAVFAALEHFRIGDERGVQATRDEIELGRAIIDGTMSSFALECALKGLFQTLGKGFTHKHDLLLLFDQLPTRQRDKIEAVWKEWTLFPETQRMTFRDFVKKHKTHFVDWRYLEGGGMTFWFGLWFAAAAASPRHHKVN